MTKSNKYLKFLFVFLFLFMVFGLAACDNADKKAAQAVDSAIEALPAEVTLADEEAILSAREEYDKLTDKQKELVTKLEILESKESELQDLKDIKAVEDLIAAIPETVTLADQAKIQAARTAYNALSSALQSRVSNLEDLEDAEEAYQELVASQQAVDAVIDLIDDLPDAEDATLDDEEDVNDAKAAFDALKENEKEQVTNVDKLNALIAKIAQLKADQEDRDAAEAVDLMIALLPVLVQLADKELVEEARAAYDALTETQKALITGLDKLEAAETRIVDLEAAKVVIDMIAALPETLALDDEDDVIAAREAYEALSEVRKSMVTNLDLLRAKEEELEILKNPDLAVLNPLIKQIPDQIIDDFTFPTAEGVTWSYKDGEDDSLFDLEAGILLKTSFETALRTIEVSYGETTLELVINFGVVKEDFTPIFYVGGAAADKPAEGNNWDGYGTWDKQLAKTGFGGYLIEYGNKVYFISKDAFIPLVGTEENEHLDRETLRPLGMNGQDSRNNLGLINGIPTEYAGTAALYYNAGDVPIKFYGCDTYGRVNAVFAGYGKVVFSRQEDGSYKVGPMIPEHGGGDDVGTKEGSYIITLNPGDYLWTPHTWETDYNNSGFGTRLCSAQGVLTENSPITVKKFKFVQEFEVEYNLDGGTNNPGNPAKIKNYELPFTLKDPVKEGYKFLGWYTKADFSGDPVEKLEELTGKVKLYAKWEAIDYNITYELDGGENDPDNPDKYNIAELPLTLKDPVKEGYNFLGWFDNADFAGDPLEQLDGVSGDITLYAKWEETEYTITYETNGGAFVYPTKQEMIEAFLRDFYDFVSPEESLSDFMHGVGKTSGYDGTWHSSHKAKIYAGARPTEVNEDYFISSAKYMEKWLPFFDMMDEFVKINPDQSFWGGTWTGNIRIREYIINKLPGPAWTEEDMNMMPDPLIQYAPISVFTASTEDFDLPVPHRDGFVFGGWFDNPAFDGEKISKVAEGTKENLTLYARWLTTIDAEVDYNVALNASHGTYYIKVTVPGESLDKDSVDSIYVIMEAGTFVEPRALTPDTDAMMWFGVAKFDGLMYKEAGKYGYEVTRKDGTSYQFFFDYDPEEVVGLPERIEAEVDYNAVYNESHERWYIKVTPGEPLDENSIKSIKTIKEAGEYLAEPKVLVPDTDTVLWFGVADETGDLGYKEAGEYAFLVTRKDDSQYVFKFDYDPEEVAGVIPNIQAVRDASVGTDVYTQGVVTSVIGNNAFIQDGSAGIYLYLGSNSSYADILVVGNLVRVNGKRAVFNSLVQISNISSIELVATEQELPEAVEFDGYVEISDLKDLQGSLVTLTGFKIKSIPTIGSGSYNIIITNDIVDVTIRVEQYVVEFSDIKDIMLSLFANQYVDWHNLPVGQYYADPQLMLSSVGQIDVKELTDNDIAQFIYDEIGAMYNDKVYPMNSIIELITAHSVYGGTISWESNNEVIDVETGQIGTVSEDTVVYLNATIKYGEAELLKTVAVTVKFIGEGLQLEYHFDFQSGGGTSYEEETYSFKNLVDNSAFEVNVHRIAANTTGAVEGATRALVICPIIGGTNDGTAWAEFDFGETVVKQMEFDCYFWNSSAKQYFTKCELQVKDGDEWVTVLDILEELGDSLDINTFTVYDLEGSLFRFYAEGGRSGKNDARILVDNLKVFA